MQESDRRKKGYILGKMVHGKLGPAYKGIYSAFSRAMDGHFQEDGVVTEGYSLLFCFLFSFRFLRALYMHMYICLCARVESR